MPESTIQRLPRDLVTVESLKQAMLRYARYSLGREWDALTDRERFIAASLAVRDTILEILLAAERRAASSPAKRVYYFSMEYLAGRALLNNVINLGIERQCAAALAELDSDLLALCEQEADPGLGNGGLGRLAACFVDSMATLGVPGFGYGINYEYGLFRQAFQNGYQVELPDVWRDPGTPWLIQRPDLAKTIPVYGRTVDASRVDGATRSRWIDTREIVGVPADMPVVGYGGRTVNYLRLYSAHASKLFDVEIFNAGDYLRALEEKISSERISKVLYPSDDIPAGRELRLLQEYFFVACSLRDILTRHGKSRDQVARLDREAAIQLNDTHPAVAVAELMRMLLDEYGMPFTEALEITRRTLAYTNHTLLPEAQESWAVELFGRVLPRHLEIIRDIDERFLEDVGRRFPGEARRGDELCIISPDGARLRMMNLAIIGSHAVNGVSRLHTRLLTTRLVPGFHALWPEKFQNKTNGVTQRRWLLKANPELAQTLSRHAGARWIVDLEALAALEARADDPDLLDELARVKRHAKQGLAGLIRSLTGQEVAVDTLFDVQIKRIHEYKRQLMNALRIVHDYLLLAEDGRPPAVPRTYLFGGKAAPGYAMAKKIIKLIHTVAEVVNGDPRARDWMRVVYLPDYRVTLAERIIPAADLSEQISTAGMEASGTGNMKFMMNGALTVGTLDGANIEMLEAAGADHMFMFGLTAEAIDELRRHGGHDAAAFAARDPLAVRVLEAIESGPFKGGPDGLFGDILAALRHEDRYFVLKDLAAFLEVQRRIDAAYLDERRWTRSCLLNIARSGRFSSDRTIREYAREIWGVLD